MDTRSLHIIWCNVINKIYPTVILYWELEIRCSCTHFTCSRVWTNYTVKHQIRLILILRIHSAIYEGLATKSFRCSRMFWTALNNNIQFIFVSYLMNEVKSIWWTCMAIFRRYESPRGEELWLDICMKKSKF